MINYQNSLDRIYQYLIIAAFFLLPLTVSGNNIAIWLIIILFFTSGDYKNKIKKILSNKLAIVSILFFTVHIIGLLWTEDILWGLEISRKMLPFFFVLPVFLTITRTDNIGLYIAAFLLAISISETISYLIWFGIIDAFKYATWDNPTALMSHISYNPLLAFAIYIVLNKLFSDEISTQFERGLYTFFALTMSINMFITGGRAGQVMFFGAIAIVAFQYFRNSQIKAIFTSIFLIILISFVSFNSSTIFKKRIMSGVTDIVTFQENKNTSIGQRVTFVVNSFELFLENPFLGVGTGDFPKEYLKVNKKNSPNVQATVQPHNMYMLVLSQLGIMGLVSFFSIFYYQFSIALSSKSILVKNIGISMPLLFLLIMWSDSYLLGHYTSNLYILFSSFIYSNNLDD